MIVHLQHFAVLAADFAKVFLAIDASFTENMAAACDEKVSLDFVATLEAQIAKDADWHDEQYSSVFATEFEVFHGRIDTFLSFSRSTNELNLETDVPRNYCTQNSKTSVVMFHIPNWFFVTAIW